MEKVEHKTGRYCNDRTATLGEPLSQGQHISLYEGYIIIVGVCSSGEGPQKTYTSIPVLV